MPEPLPQSALNQLFFEARTTRKFLPREVSDQSLRELAEIMRWGPTANNSTPARLFFVKSKQAKMRLDPLLSAGNREHTMAAPVTAIVGYDLRFYEHFKKLAPHVDVAKFARTPPQKIEENAFRNSSLQGAYMIIAARALGLACGPMSGFDNAGVDREFFSDGRTKSNFLCNLGYAAPDATMRARAARLDFDEFCKIL
jgi:3-hydroxypropanoate dehydrogenase